MNGTRIDDRYAVLERLDRGGASLVFLVEDTREKQARRVLRLLARSERRDSTLDRELGNLASVAHPSLQRVHDSGFTDFALPDVQGRFSYVVLERVLGSPIKTVAAHASWDLFVQ